MNIGNEIYQTVGRGKAALFDQGELAQLTYLALESVASNVKEGTLEEIEINYPVGYLPDKSAISSSRIYKKQELIDKYYFLGNHQLAINGLYQLVAIIEVLLSDVLKKVILAFPNKIGPKRVVKSSLILGASSLEEIHLQVVNAVLNELAYKSPKDFSEECKNLLSINLLECPSFHKYMEVKATRDIYIHNQGIANDIYIQKSSTHARVKAGERLHIDAIYFLESYEACLQITEWLEQSLHEVWHSNEFEEYKTQQSNSVQQGQA